MMILDKFSGQCMREFNISWSNDPCVAKNCKTCGLSSNFCAVCKDPFKANNGRCEEFCPAGFFDAKGHCYKCSPECKTCSGWASKCEDCHSEKESLHGKTILSKQGSRCVDKCLSGEYTKG